MIAFLIFLIIIIGLNCIPMLIKSHSPKLEKVVSRIVIITTIAFVFLTFLLFNDYRLKGVYSYSIICLSFILSSLLFFSLIKFSIKKLIKVLFLTPLILVSLFFLWFNQALYKTKINDTYSIEVSQGAFFSCGENIKITKSKFVFFEKAIYYGGDICLVGINKIETIEFNNQHAVFLIHHNGEYHSENPYNFVIENNNLW
jgi:hypothetical protein